MSSDSTRRDFLKTTSLAAASLAAAGTSTAGQPEQPGPAQTALPRWRGFNLLNFFQAFDSGERSDGMVREDDLRWMRDWGFDFIRIPMDYWLWVDSDWQTTRTLDPDDVLKIKESTLEQVDRTVELGRKYGLHVNLNFHRAPGYCINNREREPFVLWSDTQAEDAFVHHWDVFAKRYKGIGSAELSFNLVNEAPRPREGYMSREDYRRVMTRATDKIRETSPDRLIIIDGLSVGREVVAEMIPTGVAQGIRGYYPSRISHFRASWVDRESKFREPTWPLLKPDGSVELDRSGLERFYAPWAEVARKGARAVSIADDAV
ncbi:MAG: glycoside hydrolase family 5 protein, partial [Armatimonadota bacterium]